MSEVTLNPLKCALDEAQALRGQMDVLRAENAKLRELALDLYDAIDSVFWDGETKTKERFKRRMRELRVEVDDA